MAPPPPQDAEKINMYILGISGSPRRGGNTETLLDRALDGAKEKGAKTEKIILNELKMVPCQECDKVNDDGTCRIEDGFQTVYEKIKKADGIILASPIFFGSLSAQTKIMIDRHQCYWRYKYMLKKPIRPTPKKGVLILVEASKRESFFDNAKSIVKNFFATINTEYNDELLCEGIDTKKAILGRGDYLDMAFELGRKIV